MRIGLTGTSGTGKTTLANKIAEAFGLELITNVVRSTPGGQKKRVNQNATAINQMCIVTTLAAWSEIDNTVQDRTPLDGLIHSYGIMNQKDYEYFEKIAIQAMNNYDLVIHCPYYGWNLKKDEWRSEDREYLTFIQNGIEKYLFSTGNFTDKIVVMPNLDVNSRMQSISYVIAQKFGIIGSQNE